VPLGRPTLPKSLSEAESAAKEAVPEGLLALIASIDGPADLAEQHDDLNLSC
jgi:hypothetical protein